MNNSADKYKKQIAELTAACPHDALVQQSHYVDGSYYDKTYTNYWDECVCCGKRFNQTGWYG